MVLVVQTLRDMLPAKVFEAKRYYSGFRLDGLKFQVRWVIHGPPYKRHLWVLVPSTLKPLYNTPRGLGLGTMFSRKLDT